MDKYDVLMNFKRQGTGTNTGTATRSTASASPSASPTLTPSPSPSPTPTPTPTPSTSTTSRLSSRAVPTSSSASETTTSTSSTPPTSSTTSTSTSSTPTSTSVTSVTSVSTSSSTPITSASSTLATLTTSLVPTSSIPRTTLSIAPTTSFVRTTSGGMVFTATIVIGRPSASASAAAKKPFFQNTGAVVGVFVVVGIVATALAVFIITTFLRRRRAKQFDRDVQEAAREAALAQAPVDDDDYGNASYHTHASQPMSTERPNYAYGSAGASSWDPYGRAGAGAGGYEMHNRRTSTSTNTAPGMAGFASGDSFARAAGVDPPQGYNQPQGYGPGYGQQQQGYNNQGYNNQQQGYQSRNNTSPPQPYALAQERGPARAPPQAKMMVPEAQRQQNYNTVDAYRAGPSYGQAHPGERAEYGHAEAYGRPSEDAYGGYERQDYGQAGGSGSNAGHTNNSGPPAYAVGPAGNAGATGDRKRGASGMGGGAASVGRQPSSKSAATRYSQDDSEGSVDERPERRVLKVANE